MDWTQPRKQSDPVRVCQESSVSSPGTVMAEEFEATKSFYPLRISKVMIVVANIRMQIDSNYFWTIFFTVFFPNSGSSWGLQPRLAPGCSGAGRRRRFQKVPEGSARFRIVLVQVPEAGSGGFRKVLDGSSKFRSVGGGGRCKGSGRFWRVLLASEQNNAPMCRFEIEKTIAHDTAMYALLLLGISQKLIFETNIFLNPNYFWTIFFHRFFPQQRKLMGSSAQIGSGVLRCGSQAQVPEGSGGFRKVPDCAGAGSGSRFRRVSEGAGWFQQVPECWRRWQV